MAVKAAPIMAFLSTRFDAKGISNIAGFGLPFLSLPLAVRCKPIPQYFQSLFFFLNRQGVSR